MLLALSFFHPGLASAQDTQALGQSYTPILGYDDKNGALFGAAAFWYREGASGFNAGLYGASNFKDFSGTGNFSSITLDLESRLLPGWVTGAHLVLDKSYDYYYGEGGNTSPEDPLRLNQSHQAALVRAERLFSPAFSAGPFAEVRGRQGQGEARVGLPVAGDPARLFPDELSPAGGWRAVWDSRDSRMNPSQGAYASALMRLVPDGVQAEGEFRHFIPLGERLVQAFRATLGVSAGEPTYLYRYRLGGTEMLRGYQDNRFRGKDFYVLQEELRLHVWRMVSLNASADLGNASDQGFEAPHLSGQVGLRLGIPPSYGMKARLELGYAPDNRSLALQFGEVF
jgi:hypothetical protein